MCRQCQRPAPPQKQGLGCMGTAWLIGCGAVVVFVVLPQLAPGTIAKAKSKKHGKGPAAVLASASARQLLTSRRVELTPNAQADLQSGRVNGCLVRLLAGLAKRHTIAVSVLKTGHTKYVAGTSRVSNHYRWQGADIWKIDGKEVRAGNGDARDAAIWLLRVRGGCRPSEVGSPWDLDEINGASFTNYAHRDHLHLGI